MLNPSIEPLLSEASNAANLIRSEAEKGSYILILSHFDADGLAAAGILGKALVRLDASFHIRILKRLDQLSVDKSVAEGSDLIIFSDIGSGYLDLVGRSLMKRKVVILDHHQPIGKLSSNVTHVNPHTHGFDGARDISGAGVAYLVAKSIEASNVDLSTLAIVGALGDMQDKSDKRSLHGLNEIIVDDAVKAGLLKVETDLVFYGRETRPLHKALAYTTNPFLPGLTGKEDECLALLASVKIPLKHDGKWRALADLSTEEKQTLLSKIIEYIAMKGFPGKVALNLIGTVYTLLREERWTPTRDAREYSSLLNACGRMDKPSLALAVCMGERGGLIDEVQRIIGQYRKTLAQCMEWLTETPDRMKELEALYVIHGGEVIDENMTGAISSILPATGLLEPNKAIIVIAKTEEGDMKISARATEYLLEKGVNLGAALQELAKKYSGTGGGHDVAAGAQIPGGLEDKFIRDINEVILKQIRR
jgi:RecJ-like exonuclease